MANFRYGDVPFGIWTGNGVTRLTIANLTLRDFYFHPVIFNAGTQQPRVYNVRLVNAANSSSRPTPTATAAAVNRRCQCCVLRPTKRPRSDYTNGVDAHGPRLDHPAQPLPPHPVRQGPGRTGRC
jgi:hypothetical protein